MRPRLPSPPSPPAPWPPVLVASLAPHRMPPTPDPGRAPGQAGAGKCRGPTIPHLEGKTIVDGAVRVRVKRAHGAAARQVRHRVRRRHREQGGRRRQTLRGRRRRHHDQARPVERLQDRASPATARRSFATKFLRNRTTVVTVRSATTGGAGGDTDVQGLRVGARRRDRPGPGRQPAQDLAVDHHHRLGRRARWPGSAATRATCPPTCSAATPRTPTRWLLDRQPDLHRRAALEVLQGAGQTVQRGRVADGHHRPAVGRHRPDVRRGPQRRRPEARRLPGQGRLVRRDRVRDPHRAAARDQRPPQGRSPSAAPARGASGQATCGRPRHFGSPDARRRASLGGQRADRAAASAARIIGTWSGIRPHAATLNAVLEDRLLSSAICRLPGQMPSSSAALDQPADSPGPRHRHAERADQLGDAADQDHLAVGGHPGRHQRLVDLGLARWTAPLPTKAATRNLELGESATNRTLTPALVHR